MTALLLPYHQDERVAPHSIVMPANLPHDLVDPNVGSGDRWDRLTVLYGALADEVAASVTDARPTTVVTGDCLALLGTLAGVQRAGLDPSIVWFDAHGDVHTIASSESGYLGGMALRMAIGGDADLLSAPLGVRAVAESRAVLVDARDLDPAEAEFLAGSAITHVSVDEVDAHDLPDGPAILHVDLDVIDSAEVPGLRFPAPGGPTSSTVIRALRRLLASGRVAALDVSCPWLDPTDDLQVNRRASILADLLALRSSGDADTNRDSQALRDTSWS